MTIYTDPTQAAPALLAQIEQASRILILTHINPDGDAIGSLLGVWHMLNQLGRTSLPLASSPLPGYATWLPGAGHIQVYRQGMALPEADLIIMVDTAALSRIGRIYDEHTQALANLPIAIVDHHVTNDGAGLVNLIDPHAASTCELLYRLFQAMGIRVDADMATCLLMGITTDTQSFQTSATTASSLRVAADLLDLGAEQRRIVREVYYALPASSAELIGLALADMHNEGPIAWTRVTLAMMRETGAEDEAVDEVVRMMQRVVAVHALVVFKERQDGTTKISLRSIPSINVAQLATRWGGGGHAQAAGATLAMPPEQAEREVLPHLLALVEARD
ncbi:MAG TPA: DHH family phosphoesterase [Kouleothrix sp.]|uniref:DHH family phosphoesterase n=1 Tax=Kouleothrix sp. TaxID=2779161 RepID=UPI002D1C7F4E|nr:DHH family phosphoesterase [Kouleothrix sp.]HRC75333.1 DHH family phosphoesterase [Kouleothrix sp.]